MLKITEEVNKVVKREIGREIHLDIGDGRILEIYKYSTANDSADDYDAGWEWDSEESQKTFDALSDEEQEQVVDYIEAVVL